MLHSFSASQQVPAICKIGTLCIYVKSGGQPLFLESVTVKCRPMYHLEEYTVTLLTAAYIQPNANATLNLGHLLYTKYTNTKYVS